MDRYMIMLVIGVLAFTGIVVLCIGIVVLYNYCRDYSLSRLTYSRDFSKTGAFEGETITLIETLTNHSFFPLFNLDIQSHVTSKIKLEGCTQTDDINQTFVSSFFVMPFTKIKRHHKAVCLKRGYYKLETAVIEFVGKDIYMDSIAEIYVFPKEISSFQEEELSRLLRQGRLSNLPIMENVFEYAGIREYTYGDTISKINHKATARIGTLMVNNTEYMMGRRIKIYVNFHMPSDKHQEIDEFYELMELAMSYTAYICRVASERGDTFSYSANSKALDDRKFIRFPEGTGRVRYEELLKELAGSRYACQFSFSALIDMDINDNICDTETYIFTTYIDESIEKRVEMLRKTGNYANVVILDGTMLEKNA